MTPAVRPAVLAASRCPAPVALDLPALHQVATLLAEIVDGEGERAYG